MNLQEEKVFKETRLRNLKRKLGKLSLHGELTEEYLEVKREIEKLE